MKEIKERRVETKPERKGRSIKAKQERAKELKQNLGLSLGQMLYFGRNR